MGGQGGRAMNTRFLAFVPCDSCDFATLLFFSFKNNVIREIAVCDSLATRCDFFATFLSDTVRVATESQESQLSRNL